MTTIGIHVNRFTRDSFPRSPRDLSDAWHVIMPNLTDLLECVQFGEKYILSLGAHDTHTNLLLSTSNKANIRDIRQIENLISYVFDAPCLLAYPNNKKFATSYYKGLRNYFELIGHRTHKTFASESHLVEIWEQTGCSVSDGYMRLLPRDTIANPDQMCWTCNRPDDSRFNRAIAVYRQALISPEPQGAILNYWRALEAVAKSVEKRYAIANNLKSYRLKSVRVFHPYDTSYPYTSFNLMSKYRQHVLRYFSDLVSTQGSAETVVDHLYKKRRNPSAHADKDILDQSEDVSLHSLYEDSLLLKYMCRCAIEKYWKNL